MTLRAKLITAMIILGVFVVAMITSFVIGDNTEILLNSTLEGNTDIAKAISISIDNYLDELAKTTKTLATSPTMKGYLRESNAESGQLGDADRKRRTEELDMRWAHTDDEEGEFIQEYLSNPVAVHLKNQQEVIPDLYGEIFLTNKFGELVASTNKLTTFSHGEKYWWLEGYNGGKGRVYLDDRGYDISVGDFVLGVVVPVFDDGEVIGILKSNMRIFSLFNTVIKNYYPLYEPGVVQIARTDGVVILETGRKPLSTTLRRGISFTSGNEVKSYIYKAEDDKDYLVSISPIMSTTNLSEIGFGGIDKSIDQIWGNLEENWAIVIEMPKEVLDKRIDEQIGQFLAMGFLSIMVISIMAYFLVNSATKDITELVALTEEVGSGSLNKYMKVRSDDEIGKLAASFNKMIDRLKETMASKAELSKEICRRIEVEAELKHLSTVDELTQLYNRRAFNLHICQQINISRDKKIPLSIVMMDIDRFKRVNDVHGHGVGDEVLMELSQILSENTRKIDFVSRWGGEEFMILMPGIHAFEAYEVAERLRGIIRDANFAGGISITISAGVTELRDQDRPDDVIKRADSVMYMAKSNGRDNVQRA